MLLKHVADGFDVELRRQVHDSEIFVVEGLDGFGLLLLALRQMAGKIDVLLDMALKVHRHEGGELHEAGIDLPERALALNGHVIDQIVLEPFERLALGEFVDLGRLDAGVDRAGHQGQRRRPRGVIVLRHDRGGGERRHRRLADRHHMRARAQLIEEGDQVLGIFVEAEFALIAIGMSRGLCQSVM